MSNGLKEVFWAYREATRIHGVNNSVPSLIKAFKLLVGTSQIIFYSCCNIIMYVIICIFHLAQSIGLPMNNSMKRIYEIICQKIETISCKLNSVFIKNTELFNKLQAPTNQSLKSLIINTGDSLKKNNGMPKDNAYKVYNIEQKPIMILRDFFYVVMCRIIALCVAFIIYKCIFGISPIIEQLIIGIILYASYYQLKNKLDDVERKAQTQKSVLYIKNK